MKRALAAALRLLGAVNAPIARWGLSFSAALLALMLAVALAQIASRGLFNHTLDWAEEIARWALVWGALLAAPMGYRAAGHVARECDFTLAQVYSADEAFVTGTLGGVTPVTRIDGRQVGDGRPGPVTREASELYLASV